MLPRVHHFLSFYCRSSRVNYETLKPLFNASEHAARLTQQISFVKACVSSGFYPPTIEEMNLPRFLQHPRFSNEVDKLKANVFSKLKRHLYAERQLSNDRASSMLDQLSCSVELTTLRSIQEANRTAYYISNQHHEKRLLRRLTWLLRRNTQEDSRIDGPSRADELSLLGEAPEDPTHDVCNDVPVRVMNGDHDAFSLSFSSFTPFDPHPHHSSVLPESSSPPPDSTPTQPLSSALPDFQSSNTNPHPIPLAPLGPTDLPTGSFTTASSHPSHLSPADPILHTHPPSSNSHPLIPPAPSGHHPDSPLPPFPSTCKESEPVFPLLPPSIPNTLDVAFTSRSAYIFNTNSNNLVSDNLVTDLTNTLTDNEIQLLSKGPKFALSQPINDNTKRDATVNFCRLANELRWKEHRRRTEASNSGTELGLPSYPYKDEISQAPRYADFERKLARVNEVLSNCLNSNQRGNNSNLLPNERRTLAQLKQKDLACLPSDKGGEFCIIERARYANIGTQHLSNSSVYTQVKAITPKTIESRVNKIWKSIAQRHSINPCTTKRYVSTNTDLAKFYFLIKTHKPIINSSPKIRPIISNINCPTTKISWLLDKALKPLLCHVPSHLANTSELIERLRSMSPDIKETHIYPFSLDVVSLYTSIPQLEAIHVVRDLMCHHSHSLRELKPEDIAELLQVVIENNYFTFEQHIYKQNHGLAMGSSVSAILAILYMGHIEAKALSSLGDDNCIGLYSRYVDDIFIMTKSREEADRIYKVFNNIDSHIKFEIEHPTKFDKTHVLNLLDISFHINEAGDMHHEFYKKMARKPIFVNYKSALPMKNKMHFIRNERSRITNNCSDNISAKTHLNNFDKILKLNKYPQKFIKHPRTSPSSNNGYRRNEGTKFAYLNLPFINESVDRKIINSFRREGLNVRIYHKTNSLRSTLALKSNNRRVCTKRGCTLNNDLCFRKNVVYRISCNKCQGTYIGSTIRPLHDRIYEHLNNNNSSVSKHKVICGSSSTNMAVEVLDKETRKGNLRIREAFFINKLEPTINNKEESAADLVLF